MSGREIAIASGDGSFLGYRATPPSGSGRGIIVIQEIFGINQGMQQRCGDFAAQEYVALAPDLFWRQEPGIPLAGQSVADWARAFKPFHGFVLDKGVDDLKAPLDHLRGLSGCTGKAGCVGFCLGGKLARLVACRSSIDAAVRCYGVYVQDYTAKAANIRPPLSCCTLLRRMRLFRRRHRRLSLMVFGTIPR